MADQPLWTPNAGFRQDGTDDRPRWWPDDKPWPPVKPTEAQAKWPWPLDDESDL
jgi:hypothetical protein